VNTSVYSALIQAIQSTIQGLSLPNIQAVHLRKHPLISRDDALPEIIVSPEAEKEYLVDAGATPAVYLDYPVRVRFAFAGNQLLEDANLLALLDYREAVRHALHVTSISGVSQIFDCNLEFDPPFNPTLYQREYDVSDLRFIYRSGEGRTQ
jgi:hypothetical protein